MTTATLVHTFNVSGVLALVINMGRIHLLPKHTITHRHYQIAAKLSMYWLSKLTLKYQYNKTLKNEVLLACIVLFVQN